MIIREFYETRDDGVKLYRTYSDEGFYILQNETGAEYSEAIDVENAPYTYTETDKPIEEGSVEIPNPDPTATWDELAEAYREGVNSIDESK